ncbi:N-acetyltransferase [Nitratireductor sp. GISD-1A_MAKvit]|uniref:GNAT family N-acetyltransferase n=1 Tax=Nitratireductor sp. GISD-1A_MAKvit TaxID=3234198 RepID=UPI0034661E62
MNGSVVGGAVAPVYFIRCEVTQDEGEREALLDRVMGPKRRLKSSETLRRERLPAQGLAFAAVDATGGLVGSVRLWNVRAQGGGAGMLLLGPLAVERTVAGRGVGTSLVRHALLEAQRLGHGAVLLVGDPAYYQRFGFSALLTGKLAMPGPYERDRLLALELVPGWLKDASGILQPCGRPIVAEDAAPSLVA